MITFRHETLRAILEATEDEVLVRKAREIGAKIPREFLMFFDIWNCCVIMEALRATNLKLMADLMLLHFFTTWEGNGLYFSLPPRRRNTEHYWDNAQI
jgi:hypothetical protein